MIVFLLLGAGVYFVFGRNLYKTPTPSVTSVNTQTKNVVTIQNFAFSPASLSVKVGDTVTWNNNDNASHTVTANDGSFNIGTINPGNTGSYTFTKAGTYPYYCSFHPNMKGTITVNP